MSQVVNSADGGCILYDPQLLSQPDYTVFEPQSWSRSESVGAAAAGRGAAWFVGDSEHDLVLRHFRRGGLLGRIISDSYIYCGVERTRSFREWRLLDSLYRRGLPVPRPVAAGFVRRLGISYCADLLTERLPNVTSLAERFVLRKLTSDDWQAIGRVIARFHSAGVWHADLNAHNIQLGDQQVWILDFDKGEFKAGNSWQAANLQRLRRSLRKIAEQRGLQLDDKDWLNLLNAYSAGGA